MKMTNEQMEEELLEIMMEQCPYEIPEGEEGTAKDILREILFGKQNNQEG